MKDTKLLRTCIVVTSLVLMLGVHTAWAKELTVTGTVNPPKAEATPVKTLWNVKVQTVDSKGAALRSWAIQADAEGKFACNLGDVTAAGVRVTVLGGWAYSDSVKEHSVPLLGNTIKSIHEMRRK